MEIVPRVRAEEQLTVASGQIAAKEVPKTIVKNLHGVGLMPVCVRERPPEVGYVLPNVEIWRRNNYRFNVL